MRLARDVDLDMIAVPIGPALERAVVGTPAYVAERGVPTVPQDLVTHACINLRLPTHGGLHVWDFRKDNHKVNVPVRGRAVFNTVSLMRQAGLDGMGLAYMPLDLLAPILQGGLVPAATRLSPLLSQQPTTLPCVRPDRRGAAELALIVFRARGIPVVHQGGGLAAAFILRSYD